jgi:hypothetical protein
MSGASGFSGILRRLGLIEAVPGTPPSGQQALYIDPADHHLKRKNSAGSITDLETGGGGSLTVDDGTTTVTGVTELDVARIDDLTGGVVAVLPEITGQGDGNLNFAATETKLVSPSTESDLRLQDGGNAILEAGHPSNATPGDFIGVAFTVGPTAVQMNWAEVDSGHLGAWGQGVHVVFYDQFGNTFLFADSAGTFSRPSMGRLRQYASAPSSPSEGDSYYNTTDHTEYFWNGTAWTGPTGASFATPSVALGSSAAAGAASTVIRSDSTIAAFDATSPSTQAIGDSAAVGTAAFAARRDHMHAVTNPLTTQDDLWVGGASGAPARLAKGTDSQVLTVDPVSHHLAWATNSAGFSDPMTSRGDIIVRDSGNATARLAKGSADTYLGSDGTDVSYSAVTDAKLSTSDVTTNNVSITKHGFAPKAPNDATKYLDGTGAYTVPAGSGGSFTRTFLGLPTGTLSRSYTFASTVESWTNSSGTLTSTGGKLQLASGAESVILEPNVGDITDGEYELEYIVVSLSGTAGHGVIFRAADTSNFYMWQIGSSGSNIQLYKKVAGSYTNLSSAPDPGINPALTKVGQTLHLLVRFIGSQLDLFVSGTLVHSVIDTTFSTGRMGLRGDGTTTIQADDVKIYSSPSYTALNV